MPTEPQRAVSDLRTPPGMVDVELEGVSAVGEVASRVLDRAGPSVVAEALAAVP
ncbi:MAG: hypothetical protein KY453_12070 [Gemmatimonadetes bacterium]|nr:hypothetical protein [Gemmatimonadota bacterium]